MSPPGGDISEPVAQATLRIVKVFWGLDSNLAYRRHFPAINWLNSYSLYLDNMSAWFDSQFEGWSALRGRLMNLLQDERELEEIVQLVGMDALSAPDRLKIEAARSVREDFLQQNSFHDEDTYSPLEKQYLMMKMVLKYYDEAGAALQKGADIEKVATLPVRERIGRLKELSIEKLRDEIDSIERQLTNELESLTRREEF